MKNAKKLIALLLSMVLLLSTGNVFEAAAENQNRAIQTGYVAHYPLLENVQDISGNGNHAATTGNVTYSEGMVLPGGTKTNASNASYVTLPQGMFDGKDEVTISVWLKSNIAAGNYSALFFGTPAQNNNMPLNYWLFNPTNPSGFHKSVFTDSNNTSTPYNTEVGVLSASTAGYRNVWTHYTTVLTSDSLTSYINGIEIGSTAKTKTTSEFEDNLEAYIGRSNYTGDDTFAGSFQDLRIYDGALSSYEVDQVYIDTNHVTDTIRTQVKDSLWTRISLDGIVKTGVVTSSETISLPSEYGEASITWKSNKPELISESGIVTLPKESETVILTADITIEGITKQREFKVRVRGTNAKEYYLASYTNKNEQADLGQSLHLAYSEDSTGYMDLNSNTGICFARNTGTAKNANTNVLVTPYIFRKAEGGYGLIAANSSSTSVYLFDSDDLINFTNERQLKLSNSVNISNPQCWYDYEKKHYVIQWKGGNVQYENTTTDFVSCTAAAEVSYADEVVPAANIPDGAVISQVLEVTEEEYQRVINKLSTVTNIGVQAIETKTFEQGEAMSTEKLLPDHVTLDYSDGSQEDMKVEWDASDLAAIDTNKPGTYQIKGTVQQTQYENPFIEQRADPCILKGDDGYYYFTASYPMRGNVDGYNQIILRRSETIEGLASAEEVSIWHCDDSATENRYIWAPEIRYIAGSYYIYYTSSISNDVWAIRPHVLKCNNAEDIMNPDSWEAKGRYLPVSEDTTAFTNFSLDMTYFENHGRHYAIWAQTSGNSSLFMAEIDPDEPWKCISESFILSRPEYSWERINENVNEGASVIRRDGKLFVAFSGSGTGSEYTIGLLSADEDADLLDVNSWTKQPYPVLTSADVPGEYGPGHNSFTVDEDGKDMFVYHARPEECYRKECAWSGYGPLYDPCRHARLKRVHWAADGTPILKMTYEQELAEEFQTVTAAVTVKEKDKKEDDKAVTEVIRLINQIGNVTKDSKTKIEQARTAYNKLTADQKKLVTNYSKLTAAESQYAEIIKQNDQNPVKEDPVKTGKVYTVGNYKYKVTSLSKKTATITGVKKKTTKTIKVPNTVKISGKTFQVTAIGKSAFKGCKKASKAVIGKNVKAIHKNAFLNCKSLKTIQIKTKVLKTVNKNALKGIHKKAKIKVPATKLKDYRKKLKNKGQNKNVRIMK